MIHFSRNGRIKIKHDAKTLIFSRCFHGLGHRMQVRLYRKMMIFLHNSASTWCYPPVAPVPIQTHRTHEQPQPPPLSCFPSFFLSFFFLIFFWFFCFFFFRRGEPLACFPRGIVPLFLVLRSGSVNQLRLRRPQEFGRPGILDGCFTAPSESVDRILQLQ